MYRGQAASLVAAPWPRHKWICTDSDSELLKWFSLSDSCSLRAERPAAGGDNWEYSQIKTIRGRILPRCKLEEHCWHSIIPMQQCRQIEIFANFGPINTILIFDAPPSWHETLKHKIWRKWSREAKSWEYWKYCPLCWWRRWQVVAGGRLLILSQSTEPLISEQSRNGEIVAFPLQPTHLQLQQHWWVQLF